MKSGILIALYVLVVYFLFSLACMMVTLTNGSSWWVTKKIRLGAILLSISPTLMAGCPPPSTTESDSYTNDLKQGDIHVSPATFESSNSSSKMNAVESDSLIRIIEPKPLD